MKPEMKKALQDALKRVKEKEPQFKKNTDAAIAKRKANRKPR